MTTSQGRVSLEQKPQPKGDNHYMDAIITRKNLIIVCLKKVFQVYYVQSCFI